MVAIDVRDLTKIYPGSVSDPQGTWISSYGISLWVRNLIYRIRLVSERIPPVPAVAGLSLQVEAGEVLGLLGPNGAGKTTLIKMLAGLLGPSSGSATVNGHDVARESAAVRRSVSYVSTTGWMGLEWPLSVRESLLLYGGLSGLHGRGLARRTDEVLEQTGLTEHRHKVIQQLSHGMRQKLVLGRGLLIRTPVVFLDEPTVGLDPSAAIDVRALIADTLSAAHGQTVVISTHDVQEAESICTRIGIMNEGRLLEIGTPTELRRLVANRLVAHCRASNLSAAVVSELGELQGVLGATSVLQDPTNGRGLLRVHMSTEGDITPVVIDFLRSKSVTVGFFAVREPDLEDVFLRLTGGGLR